MVLEIAADADAVIRMEVPICASNWFITSGTFDTLQKLLVDQGAADAGDITVGPEGYAHLRGQSPPCRWPVRLSTGRGGTFTVNGRLILTGSGQRINMLTTAFNNIVEYNSANSQGMAAKYTGTGLYQYNHLVLSGGGTKILADNTTVTGSLTRSGTATLSLGSPTAKTLTYGPDAELVYGGTALQTTGPELSAAAAGGIAALRVENPAGVKLGQNLLVKNSLTLGGDLDTGTYSLTLGAQAACAGAGDVLGTVLRLEPPASGKLLPWQPEPADHPAARRNAAQFAQCRYVNGNGALQRRRAAALHD